MMTNTKLRRNNVAILEEKFVAFSSFECDAVLQAAEDRLRREGVWDPKILRKRETDFTEMLLRLPEDQFERAVEYVFREG